MSQGGRRQGNPAILPSPNGDSERGEATAAIPYSRAQGVRRAEVLERPRPSYSSLRHFSPHAHSPPPRPLSDRVSSHRSRAHPPALAAPASPRPSGGEEGEKRSPFSPQAGRALPGQTAKRDGCGTACFVSLPWLAASQLLPPPSPSSHLFLLFLVFLAAAAAPHPSAPRSAAAAAQNDAISQRHRRLRHDNPPPAAPAAPAAAAAAPAAAARPQRPCQPRARAPGTGSRNLWSCCRRRRRRRPGGRAQSEPGSAQRQWEGEGEPEPTLFKGDRAYS